ncbi:MAG TPA: serine/threonine-protein kinase [Steroidobacteraceae bacterium]|jgi:serine/threonine protein kinase
MSADSTGKGSNERWEQLQELFSRAVDLSGPERKAFVEKETTGDPALRTELLELLACDNGGARTGPLTLALGAALDTTTRDRRKALVGRTVGNYKLVSVLGHGGTGTVYLGERADRQYSAQVAVKIVDNATMQGELGLRFRAERQILASLNHANIARLLDAGETEEGNPYLVMEYVHGEPLDRYCDRQQLGLRERLQLFLDICGAVQYAHQNLVVHRDLKPANILVTAEGAPKLLDFGIAKLLDAGEAAAAMALTRMNDRLLTPEYASPEQILGRPVTTASDVYALGVVLYELLTGLRPYTVPASASQLELERSICITDPLRPSAAVKRARDSGPLEGQSELLAVAAARRLVPEKLQKRLVGDIDAIVMRALRKEPQHRYNSIEQLASDVRRYLTREPVQARQGNWIYYSQRFIRRHAFGVTAGAAFVIFLAAFAMVSTIQAQRIAEERDRAKQQSNLSQQVATLMLETFANADPLEYSRRGKPETAEELLARAGRRVREDLSGHPQVRAQLLENLGRAYRRRFDDKTAISYLRDAVALRKKLSGGAGDEDTAAVMVDLAISMRETGDVLGSDGVLIEARDILHRLGREHSVSYARMLANRGRVQMKYGKIDLAQNYFDSSLTLLRELRDPRDPEVAQLLVDKAVAYLWQDNPASAERSAREALDIYTVALPKLHPDRSLAMMQLGEALRLQGRLDEASVLFKEALAANRTIYGDDSRIVADVLDSLAKVRRAQHDLKEAEDYAQQAVVVETKAEGPNHWRTAYYRTSLAATQIERREYPEAIAQLRASITIFQETLSADHPYVASAEHYLGEALLKSNQLKDAEAVFMAAMNRSKRANEPEWRAARSASGLGDALYRQGRAHDAEPYLVNSYRTLVADHSADASALESARERIVRFYTERGQVDKLQALADETRAGTASAASRTN